MLLRLDPRERTLRFRYEGSERLYRDHLGRRVIADVEGAGRYEITSSGPTVVVETDEQGTERAAGVFHRSLLVAASEPGLVDVRVSAGRSGPVDGPEESSEGVECAGWVVAANGPLYVDDSHIAAPEPAHEFPAPFFRSARCRAGMRFVRAASVCELIDRFSLDDEQGLKERGFRVQNISAVSTLNSTFDDGTALSAPVASHLNAATWRLRLPAGSSGLILRRTYDRFHGRQRARVFVNGRLTGWWYDPGENRTRRWAVSDYGISEEIVTDEEVEITVDPPAGSALWSVGRVEAFVLRSR